MQSPLLATTANSCAASCLHCWLQLLFLQLLVKQQETAWNTEEEADNNSGLAICRTEKSSGEQGQLLWLRVSLWELMLQALW